ncbi:Mitochondrial fission process protein 1 [Biomphalaria glabrata]|nr:mitochondrial fission process protein 1-like [Biomphalaria glabrata]
MSDIFRDYEFVRIIGHSFAISEALGFSDITEDTTSMLNSLACSYILCHAAYKGYKTRRGNIVMSTVFDTLMFDGLASALIPRILVHCVCRVTAIVLNEITAVPDMIRTWGPTVIGLGALLVSYNRIDWEVSTLMNESVRRLY